MYFNLGKTDVNFRMSMTKSLNNNNNNNFRRVSELIVKRKQKNLQNFCSCENGICQALAFMATDELSSLCASLS